MNIEMLVPYVDVVAGIATAAGVAYAAITYRRQAQLQTFIEYTRRFHEVMSDFPAEYRVDWKTIQFPANDVRVAGACIAYLNLCAEEFEMHRSGLVGQRVWNIWRREIEASLCSPLLRTGWKELRGEYASAPEFLAWVEAQQGLGGRRVTSQSMPTSPNW